MTPDATAPPTLTPAASSVEVPEEPHGKPTVVGVGYLRVSTAEQADHGLGLDIQETEVRATASSQGIALARVYVDAGESGTAGLDERLDLGDALTELATGRARVLVIPRLDRLARDLIVQESLLREIWGYGADVLSCSPAETAYCRRDDASDPSRTLIRHILGAVSQYERAMIRLRLANGRRRKILRGGFGGGPVPFGWQPFAGQLVRNDDEWPTLERMLELRRSGKRTYDDVARSLNRQKLHNRTGRGWTAASVRRALVSADRLDLARELCQ